MSANSERTLDQIVEDVTDLIRHAANLVIATRARVVSEHTMTLHEAGDGYTEPHEAWIECSCGITVWGWQQYYAESAEKPEDAERVHLALMLCVEVIGGAS